MFCVGTPDLHHLQNVYIACTRVSMVTALINPVSKVQARRKRDEALLEYIYYDHTIVATKISIVQCGDGA